MLGWLELTATRCSKLGGIELSRVHVGIMPRLQGRIAAGSVGSAAEVALMNDICLTMPVCQNYRLTCVHMLLCPPMQFCRHLQRSTPTVACTAYVHAALVFLLLLVCGRDQCRWEHASGIEMWWDMFADPLVMLDGSTCRHYGTSTNELQGLDNQHVQGHVR